MNIKYLKSSAKVEQCPNTTLPEFAFIGRSNVGKSSLINMLFSNKNIAKTSSTPGKTQLINHFQVEHRYLVVDLPGYGWAKVSKQTKINWQKMTYDYILKRNNLVNVFVLIDSRLSPQTIDIEFINWLGKNLIPISIIFTKIDKKNSKPELLKKELAEILNKYWMELPNIFISSSKKTKGKKEILDFLDQTYYSIKKMEQK